MTDVDEHEKMADPPAGKVALKQISPAFLLGLRSFRKAVARQIDKVQRSVQKKEIDQPCLTGTLGRFRKLMIVGKTVDEALKEAEAKAASATKDALKNATADQLKEAGLVKEADALKSASAEAVKAAGYYTKAELDAAVKKASTTTTTTTKAVDKKGTAIIVGKNIYKITNVSKKTAEFTGTISTGKSVSIAATVKSANKVTYKVTSIAASALKGNKTITKVTIGKNVTTIGKNAFNGCEKLKTITIKSKSIKSVGKKAFTSIAKKAKVKVPSAKVSAYKKLFKKAGLPSKAKVTK